MAVTNVIATRALNLYHQGSTSLANSAAQTNATHTGGSSTNMISTYFRLSSFSLFLNYRSFMRFDLSSLSGTVTGVTLTMTRHSSLSAPNFHFLASEAADEISTSDYQDGIVGASSYPFTSDATEFTDSAFNPNDGGGADDTVTITLNSAAVAHANSVIGTSNNFKIAMVNQYDFNNTYASSGISDGFAAQGLYFFSHFKGDTSGGVNRKPLITVTTADAVQGVGKLKLDGAKIQIVSGKFLID